MKIGDVLGLVLIVDCNFSVVSTEFRDPTRASDLGHETQEFQSAVSLIARTMETLFFINPDIPNSVRSTPLSPVPPQRQRGSCRLSRRNSAGPSKVIVYFNTRIR